MAAFLESNSEFAGFALANWWLRDDPASFWGPQPTLRGELLPSRELTYPPKMAFWVDDFPFPQVGYVNSLEGSFRGPVDVSIKTIWSILVGRLILWPYRLVVWNYEYYPGKLTGIPKVAILERRYILETIIFAIYVRFRGVYNHNCISGEMTMRFCSNLFPTMYFESVKYIW